jgi:enterochelin esterase-like enzyme
MIAMALFTCCNPPKADFEADTTSPIVGDKVKLRDMSENDPDSWEWDLSPNQFEYQDGSGSGLQDPMVRFTEAGSFTVTLTVSNSSGSDVETKEGYITVLNDHSQTVMVHSPELENNLLGDSADRKVRVYLPPDYFENTSKHYPVVYLLHGYFVDQDILFLGEVGIEMNIVTVLNSLIHEGVIEPMIVVAPSCKNLYLGCKYSHSSTAGQWVYFIAEDVVRYIDDHFRKLPVRESRGIGGQSNGGYGAFNIAMKHPELFGVLYARSSAPLIFEDIFFDIDTQYLIIASQRESLTYGDVLSLGNDGLGVANCVAYAPAYAPNPDAPPFYGDFPVTADGDKIDSTWQRWLEHDPYTMLPLYRDNLIQMNVILFDCGDTDEFFASNLKFSQALTGYGITHTFEQFAGGHTNKFQERFSSVGFPFFSDHLVHE